MRRRKLRSLDIIDVHFLADPVRAPRLALLVPIERCLQSIQVVLDATTFLAVAAIVLRLVVRVGLLGATFGAAAISALARRGRRGARRRTLSGRATRPFHTTTNPRTIAATARNLVASRPTRMFRRHLAIGTRKASLGALTGSARKCTSTMSSDPSSLRQMEATPVAATRVMADGVGI